MDALTVEQRALVPGEPRGSESGRRLSLLLLLLSGRGRGHGSVGHNEREFRELDTGFEIRTAEVKLTDWDPTVLISAHIRLAQTGDLQARKVVQTDGRRDGDHWDGHHHRVTRGIAKAEATR